MHKAWCGLEEVPYGFQGHPSNFLISRSYGLKINDLNPIWVRLLGLSQLSNPLNLLYFACTFGMEEMFYCFLAFIWVFIQYSNFANYISSQITFYTRYFGLSYFMDIVSTLSSYLLITKNLPSLKNEIRWWKITFAKVLQATLTSFDIQVQICNVRHISSNALKY